MRGFIRAIDGLNKLIKNFIVAIFMIMFLATFLQVLARNMGLFSIPWSDELCRFLVIYIVYFGSGLAARSGRLIRMEVLPMLTKMGDIGLHRMYWIALIFTFLFCVMTTVCAAMAISVNYRSLSAALKIPMAVPYMALPLGCIYTFLNSLANVFELTLQDREKKGGVQA